MAILQEVIRIRPQYEEYRESLLISLICGESSKGTIVFLPTKKLCHRIHILLGLMDIKSAEFHASIKPVQRRHAVGRFTKAEDDAEKVNVLLCTHSSATGLNPENVETIINYSLPDKYEQYLNNVGQIAQNKKSGLMISFIGEKERKIHYMISKESKNEVKARKIDPEVVKSFNEKIKLLNGKIDEIISPVEVEKENQIKLDKSQDKKINTDKQTVKRKHKDKDDNNNSEINEDNKEINNKKSKKEFLKKTQLSKKSDKKVEKENQIKLDKSQDKKINTDKQTVKRKHKDKDDNNNSEINEDNKEINNKKSKKEFLKKTQLSKKSDKKVEKKKSIIPKKNKI